MKGPLVRWRPTINFSQDKDEDPDLIKTISSSSENASLASPAIINVASPRDGSALTNMASMLGSSFGGLSYNNSLMSNGGSGIYSGALELTVHGSLAVSTLMGTPRTPLGRGEGSVRSKVSVVDREGKR